VSDAADQWWRCSVLQVGLSAGPDETPPLPAGTYVLKLEAPNGSKRWYQIPSDELNRCLAIACTAASAGMDVFAYVDWTVSGIDEPIGGLRLAD
jgi:hypothetical protein